MRRTATFIRDTYKQALRGLFVAGTSIGRRSFSEGDQPKVQPTFAKALAGKGKRSAMNQD
jgi:hypothetical protein